MEQLIELKVLGVTSSQLHAGAYALLLEEVNGTRRIPIVVGVAEAQAIAVRLEGVIPPRPLTHDLMTSVFHAFGVELESVTINSFENGVFSSLLNLKSNDSETRLDSRTSDAIALALRTGARIFITPEVIAKTGYDSKRDRDIDEAHNLEELTTERLKVYLQRHVENEEYEKAAEIQKIIEARCDE